MIYSLLVIDDEREIVDYLYDMFSNIDTVEFDVYKANSGENALEILDRVKIDIVLSDIKMPGITGLQLIDKIKENWPESKIIFLTGYKEFDYIYKATRYQDIGYVLKTSGDEEIINHVLKAVDDIEKEITSQKLIDNAEEKTMLANAVLKRDFLTNIILGIVESSEITKERLEKYNIAVNISEEVWFVVAKVGNLSESIKVKSKEFIFGNIEILTERNLPKAYRSIQLFVESRYIAWIIVNDKNNQPKKDDNSYYLIKGAFQSIQSNCKRITNTNISFAINTTKLKINEMNKAYPVLKQTLNSFTNQQIQAILTDKSLFEKKNWIEQNNREDSQIESKKNMLGKIYERFEFAEREEFLKDISPAMEYLSNCKSMNSTSAIEIYLTITLNMLKYINQYDMVGDIAFMLPVYKLGRIEQYKSWKEAVGYI